MSPSGSLPVAITLTEPPSPTEYGPPACTEDSETNGKGPYGAAAARDAVRSRTVTTPATLERHRFADCLLEVGPDAPTLCEGWTARDLAAHVVLRDSRPDATPGAFVAALAKYTERVQRNIAAGDWDEIVETVRSGPPRWSPTRIDTIDRLVNTTEFFIHHEDVRRAVEPWEPRPLPDDLVNDLDTALKRTARLFARKAPAGLTLQPDDGHAAVVAKDLEPMVTVSGPVGELVLWIFGRQAHTEVSYDGDADAVEALRTASFGI